MCRMSNSMEIFKQNLSSLGTALQIVHEYFGEPYQHLLPIIPQRHASGETYIMVKASGFKWWIFARGTGAVILRLLSRIRPQGPKMKPNVFVLGDYSLLFPSCATRAKQTYAVSARDALIVVSTCSYRNDYRDATEAEVATYPSRLTPFRVGTLVNNGAPSMFPVKMVWGWGQLAELSESEPSTNNNSSTVAA